MRSLKTTTRCHSVFSRRSPEFLSRQLSEVARERLATRVPSCVLRISGSRPRLPTRMTLLTLPAMTFLFRLPFALPADPPPDRRESLTISSHSPPELYWQELSARRQRRPISESLFRPASIISDLGP